MKRFSVIVPTWNRCEQLKMALTAIFDQTGVPQSHYELIVVDNNSTDKTPAVVQAFQLQDTKRIQYLFEPRQGVNYARNLASHTAQGEILVFTDDDTVVDRYWLKHLNDVFERYAADAVGGRIWPRYPPLTPTWIKDNRQLLSGPICNHDNGEGTFPYDVPPMLPFVSANFAIRNNVLKECGYFREDLGPGQGTYGDDTELFWRLKYANKKIYYTSLALVWHPVRRERMTWNYIAAYFLRYGRFAAKMELTNDPCRGNVCWVRHPKSKFFLLLYIPALIYYGIRNQRTTFINLWEDFFMRVGMLGEFIRKKPSPP